MTHDASTTEPSQPGWRFRFGVALFALGLVCPVFVPLVAATDLSTEWKAILSGLLMLGVPELLWVVAVHRIGMVPAGEASLYVRVEARHRREAFVACQSFIDQMKRDVPVWKHPMESS